MAPSSIGLLRSTNFALSVSCQLFNVLFALAFELSAIASISLSLPSIQTLKRTREAKGRFLAMVWHLCAGRVEWGVHPLPLPLPLSSLEGSWRIFELFWPPGYRIREISSCSSLITIHVPLPPSPFQPATGSVHLAESPHFPSCFLTAIGTPIPSTYNGHEYPVEVNFGTPDRPILSLGTSSIRFISASMIELELYSVFGGGERDHLVMWAKKVEEGQEGEERGQLTQKERDTLGVGKTAEQFMDYLVAQGQLPPSSTSLKGGKGGRRRGGNGGQQAGYTWRLFTMPGDSSGKE